jgi:hypothetical protein
MTTACWATVGTMSGVNISVGSDGTSHPPEHYGDWWYWRRTSRGNSTGNSTGSRTGTEDPAAWAWETFEWFRQEPYNTSFDPWNSVWLDWVTGEFPWQEKETISWEWWGWILPLPEGFASCYNRGVLGCLVSTVLRLLRALLAWGFGTYYERAV